MRIVVFAACAAFATNAGGEPYHPAGDEVVVGRLPAAVTDRLRAWRESVERNPERVDIAVAAARGFLLEARSTSDPRYEGYAQVALGHWWDTAQAPTEVLMVRAALYERRHDFDSALADLDRVLTREPFHAQAWLSRASILQVRGEYEASLQGCLQLPAGRLVRAACIAGAEGLSADGDDALTGLRTALQYSRRETPQMLAWAEAVRADIAMAHGYDEEAEAALRNGLRMQPDDVYLLAVYADYLIDRGRHEDAVRLLSHSDTDNDALELQLRRARALRAGSAEAQALTARLEDVFAAARRRGDPPHARSEAYLRLFVTAEPGRALDLALANFRMQREPFDVRLVLEAALASGRPAAAQPALAWLREAGVRHVALAALAARLEARGT